MNINQLIKPKFEVDGQLFDTVEAAQEYLDSQDPDKLRLEAFLQHMRDNGTTRISATVKDTVTAFIAFEKGLADGTTEAVKTETQPEAQVVTVDDKPPFDTDNQEATQPEEEEVVTEETTAGENPLETLAAVEEEEVLEETQAAASDNAKVGDLFGSDSMAEKEEPKNLFG